MRDPFGALAQSLAVRGRAIRGPNIKTIPPNVLLGGLAPTREPHHYTKGTKLPNRKP
jgi:hypothetical protein